MKILENIASRKKYPLIPNAKGLDLEAKYIEDQLENAGGEFVGLVFPVSFLDRKNSASLRDKIFSKYHLAGIVDIGSIWAPATNLSFSLFIVSKSRPAKVFLAQYTSKEAPFKVIGQPDYSLGTVPSQEVNPDFEAFVHAIQSHFQEQTTTIANGRSWEVLSDEIDLERLSLNFYDPENATKLAQEKTLPLHEVCEILTPRPQAQADGKKLTARQYSYPLNEAVLPDFKGSNVQLKQYDLIVPTVGASQNIYLVTNPPKSKIFATTNQCVLRVTNKNITPEYLFLYLQSETAQKYFSKYYGGSFIQRISVRDFRNLPVIVPDKITQERSKKVFWSQFVPGENIIQTINKALFEKKVSNKPIQKELTLELLEGLKFQKQEVLDQIIKKDFNELEQAKKHKLYKSFVVIAGSALEAFLLDWLSEKDGVDYFEGNKKIPLHQMAKTLFEQNEELLKEADFIRGKRNLVHPRNYYSSQVQLSDELCEEILSGLRLILNYRK